MSLLLGLVVQNAAFVALAAWGLRRNDTSLGRAGLAKVTGGQALLGITLGLLMTILAQAVSAWEMWLLPRLLPASTYHALERLTSRAGAEATFVGLASPALMLAFALLGSLIAPLGEECLFRGWLYTALKRRFGSDNFSFREGKRDGGMADAWTEREQAHGNRTARVTAALMSAGVFALLHFSPLGFLPLFLMGLAFAVAYERTGSLWVPILMHGANNGAAFALLAWGASGR